MSREKRPETNHVEKLIDHWDRLLKLIDSGVITLDHATIAVAAATKLLLESGAYVDEEGDWQHASLRKK